MCIGGGAPPRDDSAERARREEEARNARIRDGETSINKAFEGFNDDYFNQYTDAYQNNYAPQLDEQYIKAKQKTTFGLSRTGNLQTSAGANRLGDLFQAYSDRKGEIADQALAAANDLRTRVEQNRSDLYTLNRGAADPAQATSMAAARAGVLQSPQTFSPLGDAFSSFVNNAGMGLALEARGFPGLRTGLFNQPSAGSATRGSGRVVS